MNENLWEAYVPDTKNPWDLRRVVHLHRRAALGATWAEAERDLKEGPVPSVDRLLGGSSAMRVEKDFEDTSALLFDTAATQSEIGRLKAAWFHRLLFGPDPLREKLILLWHDHFATANSKVDDVALMRRQNDTLRKLANGKFADLLHAALREPALLIYLDSQTNRKGHPNENLARELMELFTLGLGRYGEEDVKEAARALTGWSVQDGQFVQIADLHDEGEKSIFGKKAKFDGQKLLSLLLARPEVAERIAFKLIREFFGEQGVSLEAKKQLCIQLRETDLDIAHAVTTILRSRLFFDSANIGSRVLSPVEFVVGAARRLEMFDPAPSTLVMAEWSARMGQDLFDPPNVAGWKGGRNWINSRSLIARANYATALVSGPNVGRNSPYDPSALAKKYGLGGRPAELLVFHHRLFYGTDPDPELSKRLGALDGPKMVAALLSSPESQRG